MVKRMLDCTASTLRSYGKKQLLESIAACEGRILMSETIGSCMPVLSNVTNAEFASSMGADILLLNMFDVQNPVIQGLPKVENTETIRELKRLTGRMIGINLEPVTDNIRQEDTPWAMTEGRRATVENARLAMDMGVDLILLTGNPGNGVSNQAITDSLKAMKKEVGDTVILAAGKMHASGILAEGGERIITKDDIGSFMDAGADMILLPAPGTIPGITMEYIRELISFVHSRNLLTITAIGTSQEGSDTDTLKRIALLCKMAGADIHHIGDSWYTGMAAPDNIFAYSVAIRGVRHTYHRMAESINR